MSQKLRLGRKIDFQNMFYTKCINVIIDSIGPSIILRSILKWNFPLNMDCQKDKAMINCLQEGIWIYY